MNSSRSFSISLFGTPVVLGPGAVPVRGPAAQRHRLALLALLALSSGRCATRDRLLGYLWPESHDERARQLLNQAVYKLRKALGDEAIVSAGDELRLNTDALCVDVVEFERSLADGDAAGAVRLYRGPLLDGFYLSDAPEFEQRIEQERQRHAALYAEALETLAAAAERQRDFAGAVAWWKARAAHDPYDSRVALRLMQTLDAGGNRAGALQHAAVHTRVLHEEFGIAPAPEVAALTARLRAEPAPASVAPVASAAATIAPALAGAAATAAVAPVAAARLDAGAPEPDAAPGAPTQRRKNWSVPLRVRYAMIAAAAAAAALGASFFWAVSRDADARWLEGEALPRIEEHLAVADWESAFALVGEVERRVRGSREVAELWPRVSWLVSLESEPAGATVFRQAYDAPDDAWQELGRTPLTGIRIPYGLSRVRVELAGHRPLIRALGGAHINWHELMPGNPHRLLVGPELFRLDTEATLPRDMVRVAGGSVDVTGVRLSLADFFIGRHEITNAEYRTFVEAGGYQRGELWDPVVVNGNTLTPDEAMALFVDRTGRPGPSTWEGGDYPQGEDDFPVSGVSWYEAAAYARYVGRELPSAHHWQHAIAVALFPWLLPASNFSGGPRRVTEGRAMTHVGAYDMTGNVREWTSTALDDERVILGGSWNDPYYIAGTTDTSAPPLDRSAGNGIRVVVTNDEPAVAARLRAPMSARTTASPAVVRQPVSDDVFAAYSRIFHYDARPLDALVAAADTTRLWIRERVTFDAGYGGERMLLNLYLPSSGRGPYQTVVYWPGWDTFALDDVDEYFAKQVDFIVKSGRAVAFPVYYGIFERRVGSSRARPDFGTAEYRDNTIHTVKDLRRTIDYLETRSDVDRGAIAFFGYSWGGVNGPVALAQDPRIRVSVIKIGLLPPMSATPEVDPLHALPRVRTPTLMFSGEFDSMVPLANARRYFDLLGTADADKRHVVAIGGHFIPRHLVIRETLDWLDRYLGPVSR